MLINEFVGISELGRRQWSERSQVWPHRPLYLGDGTVPAPR
jgi:hypothetical protein